MVALLGGDFNNIVGTVAHSYVEPQLYELIAYVTGDGGETFGIVHMHGPSHMNCTQQLKRALEVIEDREGIDAEIAATYGMSYS